MQRGWIAPCRALVVPVRPELIPNAVEDVETLLVLWQNVRVGDSAASMIPSPLLGNVEDYHFVMGEVLAEPDAMSGHFHCYLGAPRRL